MHRACGRTGEGKNFFACGPGRNGASRGRESLGTAAFKHALARESDRTKRSLIPTQTGVADRMRGRSYTSPPRIPRKNKLQITITTAKSLKSG
jgi:hypothetical protein